MDRRVFLLAAPAVFATSKAQSQAVAITGAGATFPAPLYYSWAARAARVAELRLRVNYQSIGSGGGINQIRARTVDFGATDAPLADPGDMYQFPTVEGRVVPIYNLPGISNLNLNMSLIVQMYQGRINFWNDPQIAALNPNVNLPRVAIVPIYRADGSGTTFIWTGGMRDSNSGWTDAATSISWPVGTGARGNEGVSNTVQRVRGAIGYVEYIYSRVNNIPTVEGFDAPRGKTYILLPKEPKNRSNHDACVRFFEWSLTHGLEVARTMHYHTLPEETYAGIIRELKSM